MIVFIKLLLAHLIGDFLLQPAKWVADKESRKLRSHYFYLHLMVHGFIAAVLVFETRFAEYALFLAAIHGIIDYLKLRYQRRRNRRRWFVADQLMHVVSIGFVAWLYTDGVVRPFEIDARFWLYATAVLFLTSPASITIRNIISAWTPDSGEKRDDLEDAGKYIGILERLFIFGFILIGQFEAIGFLLAAKSIFRFGDLTQSKDRRLTEYVLIGTLLSFGLAICTGLLAEYFLRVIEIRALY